MRRWQWSRAPLALGAMLLFAGCGAEGQGVTQEPVATATSEVQVATETPAPEPIIGEVVWTTAVDAATNEPAAPVTEFSVDAPAIFAVIAVQHVPQGSVLSASWTYNDAPLDGVGQTITTSQPYRGGFVEFHLTRSDGQTWPVGAYTVSISFNGAEAQAATVRIVRS